jgi:hypothetical protein
MSSRHQLSTTLCLVPSATHARAAAAAGTNNDIKVEYNECGCVYKMVIKPQHVANNSLVIGMFPTTMYSLWCGSNKSGTDADNKCDVNNLASPDNIAYMKGLDHLLVAEDTSTGHQNDVLWLYDLKDGASLLGWLTAVWCTAAGACIPSPWRLDRQPLLLLLLCPTYICCCRAAELLHNQAAYTQLQNLP